MIFSLYTVYKNHDDDNNWRSNHRKIANIIASARIVLLSIVNRFETCLKIRLNPGYLLNAPLKALLSVMQRQGQPKPWSPSPQYCKRHQTVLANTCLSCLANEPISRLRARDVAVRFIKAMQVRWYVSVLLVFSDSKSFRSSTASHMIFLKSCMLDTEYTFTRSAHFSPLSLLLCFVLLKNA